MYPPCTFGARDGIGGGSHNVKTTRILPPVDRGNIITIPNAQREKSRVLNVKKGANSSAPFRYIVSFATFSDSMRSTPYLSHICSNV